MQDSESVKKMYAVVGTRSYAVAYRGAWKIASVWFTLAGARAEVKRLNKTSPYVYKTMTIPVGG